MNDNVFSAFKAWLAISMPIYSNFQINETSGETQKLPYPYFASKIRGLKVS